MKNKATIVGILIGVILLTIITLSLSYTPENNLAHSSKNRIHSTLDSFFLSPQTNNFACYHELLNSIKNKVNLKGEMDENDLLRADGSALHKFLIKVITHPANDMEINVEIDDGFNNDHLLIRLVETTLPKVPKNEGLRYEFYSSLWYENTEKISIDSFYTYYGTIQQKFYFEFDDEDLFNWRGGDDKSGYYNLSYEAMIWLEKPLNDLKFLHK